MTTTWNQLSRPLRAAIAAPWCLLAALTAIAATPATRALLLDTGNHPTADVSLASPHWVDTLDPARLPTSVALFDPTGNNLTVPGTLTAGQENVLGPITWDYGLSGSDGSGNVYAGGSLYFGVSAPRNAGITGPSGASLNDDGNGGWVGPGELELFCNGGITTSGQIYAGEVITAEVSGNGNPSINLSYVDEGYLQSEGSNVLAWFDGAVEVYGTLSADRLTAFSGAILQDDGNGGWTGPGGTAFGADGTITAGNNVVVLPGGYFAGNGGGLTNVTACALVDPASGAAFIPDGAGGWNAAGGFYINANGSFYADGAAIASDGAGTLTAAFFSFGQSVLDGDDGSIYASGPVKSDYGLCMFGAPAVTAQPAHPTTLAQIIAIGQAYGWWQ